MPQRIEIAIEVDGGDAVAEAIKALAPAFVALEGALEGFRYRQVSLGHVGEWKPMNVHAHISVELKQGPPDE